MASFDHGQGHTKSGTPSGLLVESIPLSFRCALLAETRTPVDGFSPPLSWGCSSSHLSAHPYLWKCGLLFHHFSAGPCLLDYKKKEITLETLKALLTTRAEIQPAIAHWMPHSCLNVTPLSNKSNHCVPPPTHSFI